MVEYHRGHYNNPLTNEEIEVKFNTLGRDLLSPAQGRALLSRIWNLEQVDDVGDIMQLLVV